MTARLLERDRFLSEWRYSPGEHVTILGPTGSGKTHLAYQLLSRAASPKLPAVILVMKPRDGTVSQFTRDQGYRRVRVWPPRPTFGFARAPAGYTLWPKVSLDLEDEGSELEMRMQFLRAMNHAYRRGNYILFADEVADLCGDLRLKQPLTRLWRQGRSMHAGLWAATQRPVEIPLHAYSQPEHIFVARDPDLRTRKRYAEIGGIDPEDVIRETSRLPRYHWLYIRRSAAPDYRIIGP